MVDKVLVTNRAALTSKYGSRRKEVDAAVKALIAADKARGLTTRLIDLSDAATMKKYKARAVTKPDSGRQNKDAVDAVFAALKPDYLVILDAPDVVAHLSLSNPVPGDEDDEVPSDLPYASDAPFIKRDAAHYAAVTRVVGRIPGVLGSNDPSTLVRQLKASARSRPRRREHYLKYFAISNALWRNSTALSVGAIFGTDTVKLCPPSGPPGVNRLLSAPTHFINCHGAAADPQFYGETPRGAFPVAMNGRGVKANSRAGTIVAAECCYGAELYDPVLADGALPISLCYLVKGALGFLGSTNVAYGPADGNGAADLITQYFLIDALDGASLGRACLQARQKFIQSEKMEDPVNLKTLAQFMLLGDPSLTACVMPKPRAPHRAAARVLDRAGARANRRVELAAIGKSVAEGAAFPGKKLARPGQKLTRTMLTIARRKGFRSKDLSTFEVTGGAVYRQELKARATTAKVLVVTDRSKTRGKATAKRLAGVSGTRVLVAHTRNGRIIDTAEYVSR